MLTRVFAIYLSLLFWDAVTSQLCSTSNGHNAECISIYSCQLLLEAAVNANETMLKFIKDSECGPSMICCWADLSPFKSNQTLQIPNKLNTARPYKFRPLPKRKLCGWQQSDDRANDNGDIVNIDDHPWISTFIYTDKLNGSVKSDCAGSLINRRYVLTAAYCVSKDIAEKYNISVRLGEYDKLNETDCIQSRYFHECADPVVNRAVEKIIIHTEYKNGIPSHDVALVRMNQIVAYSNFVRPICLPTYGYYNATIGDTLITSGWAVGPNADNTSSVKKGTENLIITPEKCKEKIGAIAKQRVNIKPTTMCTVAKRKNAVCFGDVGGPVMAKHNAQWQQEAIVKYTFGCQVGAVATHIKVHDYVHWITDNIEP